MATRLLARASITIAIYAKALHHIFMKPMQIFLLTGLAMIAFAANSLLGRAALTGGVIGAGSFALIRLLSGAALLLMLQGPSRAAGSGDWLGAAALLIYAAFFSYAYISMDTGAGALLLFTTVQIIMVGAGVLRGEIIGPRVWCGLVLAMGGLIWWLLPGAARPPLIGAAAMAIAGAGWAAYSLLGLKGADPALRTAGNFIKASLLACLFIPFALWLSPEGPPQAGGILLAVISGAVTSGVGYTLWYKVLPSLTAAKAGICQLTVPVIAALGGAIFLQEAVTGKFALVTLLILGGVALATLPARRQAKTQNKM